MKYVIRERATGLEISQHATLDEAYHVLCEYEAEDMREGVYTERFYDVVGGEDNV